MSLDDAAHQSPQQRARAQRRARETKHRAEYREALGQEMAEFNWAIQAGTTVTYQDRFGDHLVEKVDAFFTLHCVDGYRARIADGPVWTDLLVQAGIARHTRLLE